MIPRIAAAFFLVVVVLQIQNPLNQSSLNLFAQGSATQEQTENQTQATDVALILQTIKSVESKVAQQAEEIARLKEVQQQLRNEIDRLSAEKADRFLASPSRQLFDGKSMAGWEVSSYGGEGEVTIADGALHMAEGDPISGINVVEGTELPTHNYEVSFDAMKVAGTDFFGSVTFPVNDSHCTLIVGGWGGPVIGLSNLDDKDASENGTRVLKKFEKGQWYHIRVRVLKDRITAWIDGQEMVDESIVGRKVSVRNDVIPSQPLGITSFVSSSSLKNIELRTLEEK